MPAGSATGPAGSELSKQPERSMTMMFARKLVCAMSLCAAVGFIAGCADTAAAPKKSEPAKPAAKTAPEAGSSTGGGTKVPEKK